MQLSSSLIFSAILVNIFNLVLGAPIISPSSFTIDARAPGPVAEVVSREAQGFTIGTPCFGSSKTGCTLKHGHKRAEGDLVTREAEAAPEPEPQGFTIGTPCFGSKKTGCTLKKGHKREE
ncbi:hypothetical protein VTL71DRAFT_10423 [Oculimacula yallundae]|uniref:Uncharacterized protein n=1 Tax=Oculimacula yallundae TaxID=86028 RepID=A0ABR4CVJ5_9HELO